ncbi:MAG TPA: TRAP transporter substrate-binding protein [Pseudorhodoferax sp.]|jgi:tripartite ATP-independent transporter DctP family solute receptor|nr:TRAP transporter substrate-binding protein [Pseudorhodoferax sp.]
MLSHRFRFAVLASAALAAIATAPAHAQFEARTLRVSSGVAKGHPISHGITKMTQCAAEKSGGKLKLQTYYDGALGNDTTASQQVRTGSLDMVLTSTAPLVGAIPQLAVFDLPFLFSNEREADQVLDGKFGQSFAPKYEAAGLVNLAYWENGFRSVTNSKRPVAKWEDLHGVKMRVMQNKVFLDTFSALGSNPTPLAFSEVYSALETRTVDGQENPIALIENMKFYEVQKFLSLTRHAYSPLAVLVSKKKFDQLSAQEQGVMRECAVAGQEESRRVGRAQDAEIIAKLKKDGMQVNEVSAAELQRMREKVKDVVQAQSKVIGEDTMAAVNAELQRIRAAQ